MDSQPSGARSPRFVKKGSTHTQTGSAAGDVLCCNKGRMRTGSQRGEDTVQAVLHKVGARISASFFPNPGNMSISRDARMVGPL